MTGELYRCPDCPGTMHPLDGGVVYECDCCGQTSTLTELKEIERD